MSMEAAHSILQPYLSLLDRTAPEQTIDELREKYLAAHSEQDISDFTQGMQVLLENRYLRRLNDVRLELTTQGRGWLLEQESA